ncbi:hypothetical protein EDC04DRAFT_945763 [Pisolithus marmoratus]|nr:hypothetical protein EDC04DRAFT_945763 [Pisolithus marmoratus]
MDCRAGSKVDLYTTGTVDNHTAHVLSASDQPLLTYHRAKPFGDHATYILDNRNVVGSRPRPSLPPNQLPLSPPTSFIHMTACPTLRPETFQGHPVMHIVSPSPPQSQTLTGPLKAHSVCDRNVYNLCKWQGDNTKQCGTMRIKYGDCADRPAAIHDIKNVTWHVKVVFRCVLRRRKRRSYANTR